MMHNTMLNTGTVPGTVTCIISQNRDSPLLKLYLPTQCTSTLKLFGETHQLACYLVWTELIIIKWV